jgi:geranylgeranyl diphosphate synthase type II
MTVEAERDLDLTALRSCIDSKLVKYLPGPDEVPAQLAQAMRYSVTAGGKRLRPLLVLAAHRSCRGVADENLWRTAAAIEYLHAFSLIHDDLPCMDDDDFRRGLPTCHKKFGEGMAVLAGDGLAVLAFELLAMTGNTRLVREMAAALGPAGMIGGQVADLEAEGKDVTLDGVREIHARKTAALFRAASLAGGLLASAGDEELAALADFGLHLGLAFQIVDDLLDLDGDPKVMGKTAGADLRRQKATYPKASSREQARADARAAALKARQAIADFQDRGALLALVDMATEREA